MRFADAPLTPSPDEADSLLQRELLRPEYHAENPVQQLLRWIERQLDSALDRASSVSPLGTLGALAVLLVVLVLLGWLLSRARRTSRTDRSTGSVLTEEVVTAAQLRTRALAALAAGDAGGALVDGFRALTLRQIERGVLEDQPGATAREVAASLGAATPGLRARIDDAATQFDLVLYGDRPAGREQAEAVLGLDDDLEGVR